MEKPRTIDELVEIIKNHSITQKSISKDTVRLTINTLKAMGCEIERPRKTNSYKYELKKHPFILNLSQDEVNALILMRERLTNELSWEKLLKINSFYKKVFSLTENSEYILLEQNTRPLNNINEKILKELSNPLINGRKVTLTYNSAQCGIEDINIIPQRLTFENSRLYLWCYSYKYQRPSMLDIERIQEIKNISISPAEANINYYDVEYEVLGRSAKEFNKEDNEEIIEQTTNSIKIRAKVENEFWFIQRLLLLGDEFKIISPLFFKEKLINKIKLIQKGYTE